MHPLGICGTPAAWRMGRLLTYRRAPVGVGPPWHARRSRHCTATQASRVLFFDRPTLTPHIFDPITHPNTPRHRSPSNRYCCAGVNIASLTALYTARRFGQYEMTSHMQHGINKRNKSLATRWVVKSTKDFMSEADSKLTTTGLDNTTVFARDREERQVRLRDKRARATQLNEEAYELFENEMARVHYDQDRRWRKGINFVLRQGRMFVLVYLSCYFGSLLVLYLLFSYKVVPKEGTIEYLSILLRLFIDREAFFARVAAWDSYVDLGFAFVVNEVLELIRFPLVFFVFAVLRKNMSRLASRVRSSMFVRSAPET